jgi:hypothetical protein
MSLNPSSHEVYLIQHYVQGRIQGGHTRHAPPLKLEKIRFFGVKSWFFTRNTPKFPRLPPLGAIFLSSFPYPPNFKSWICPWCDQVCQWLKACDRSVVFSRYYSFLHDITKLLFKMVLNTITLIILL